MLGGRLHIEIGTNIEISNTKIQLLHISIPRQILRSDKKR